MKRRKKKKKDCFSDQKLWLVGVKIMKKKRVIESEDEFSL